MIILKKYFYIKKMVVRHFNITYIAMIIGIFPLAIFICSAINVKVDPAKTILNELKSSLNDFPLSEITISEKCTDKYNGYLYEFPGTKSGCSCVGVYKYVKEQTGTYEVNPGSCNKNQTYNGCIKVPNYDSKKLYFWEGRRFCSKLYKPEINGYLYFLNNSVLKDEDCQTGYKKCGKLDEMNNYLCIPNDEDCPINDITISNEINEELLQQNYSYINISNNKLFYYTNSSNKPVIAKLKVAEGKLCMDRSYFYTDYPQYILDNNFNHYGCRYKINGEYYENFETLDNRSKNDFYLDSDLSLRKYFAVWKYDYPLYSLNANVSLYPKRYIGYNKNCLKKHGALDINSSPFTEEKINEANDSISYVLSKNDVIKWLSIIFLVLILLSCAPFNLDSQDYPFFIWIWAVINCILYIPLAIFIFKSLIKITKFKEFPLCSTDIINTKIKLFHSSGNTLKTTTILSFIFLHLELLFIIAIILIKYLIKYEEDDNIKNSSSKKNYSSDIDYQKPPEEPYYKYSENKDSNNNNDFNDNNNENNDYNDNNPKSAVDNEKSQNEED